MCAQPAFHLELSTDLGELAVLEDVVHQLLAPVPNLAEPEVVQYNIWLSIHELCVNIIKHAYGGAPGAIQVDMALLDEPWRVEIDTYDQGPKAYNLDAWQPPNLDDPPIHGLGIFLIQQLMDEVACTGAPGNNHWRLVKRLAQNPAGAPGEAATMAEGAGT